jgi:hypothetical protein
MTQEKIGKNLISVTRNAGVDADSYQLKTLGKSLHEKKVFCTISTEKKSTLNSASFYSFTSYPPRPPPLHFCLQTNEKKYNTSIPVCSVRISAFRLPWLQFKKDDEPLLNLTRAMNSCSRGKVLLCTVHKRGN